MEENGNRRLTNLTELWWSEEKESLLELNGYSCGSDYERLRALCLCLARAGSARLGEAKRELALLGLPDADLTDPRGLWRRGVALLEECPVTAEERQALLQRLPVRTSPSADETVPPCIPCAEFPLEESFGALHWEEWQTRAQAVLSEKEGRSPVLHLPVSHRAVKPDLYHVSRHLSGEEPNSGLWRCQTFIFLLRYCRERGIRAVVRAECSPEEVLQMLEVTRRFTALPDLILSSPFLWGREAFLRLCRAVSEGREGKANGIPPVLTDRALPFLPPNLRVALEPSL